MAAIEERLSQVEVERAYRIIGVLEHTAKTLQDGVIPRLREARASWKRRTLWLDGIVFTLIASGLVFWAIAGGYLRGFHFDHPLVSAMTDSVLGIGLFAGGIVAVALSVHLWMRQLAAHSVLAGLRRDSTLGDIKDWVVRAFARSTGLLHPLIGSNPLGLQRGVRRRLKRVLADADRYVQDLNNRFANPSGAGDAHHLAGPETDGAKRADVSVVKTLPVSTPSSGREADATR